MLYFYYAVLRTAEVFPFLRSTDPVLYARIITFPVRNRNRAVLLSENELLPILAPLRLE